MHHLQTIAFDAVYQEAMNELKFSVPNQSVVVLIGVNLCIGSILYTNNEIESIIFNL